MAVFTVDDMVVKGRNERKAKFDEKQKYRIALPWLTEKGKVRIEPVEFYRRFDPEDVAEHKRIRTSFLVPEGLDKELKAQIESVCGGVKVRYVTPILIYTTGFVGGKFQEQSLGGYSIKAWVFADDSLTQLKAINEDFPLSGVDLDLYCKDKFGNVQLTNRNTCVWKDEKFKAKFNAAAINAEVAQVAENLPEMVATRLNPYQIKSALKIADYDDEAVGVGVGSDGLEEDDIPL